MTRDIGAQFIVRIVAASPDHRAETFMATCDRCGQDVATSGYPLSVQRIDRDALGLAILEHYDICPHKRHRP